MACHAPRVYIPNYSYTSVTKDGKTYCIQIGNVSPGENQELYTVLTYREAPYPEPGM